LNPSAATGRSHRQHQHGTPPLLPRCPSHLFSPFRALTPARAAAAAAARRNAQKMVKLKEAQIKTMLLAAIEKQKQVCFPTPASPPNPTLARV
jgi:hypothetical protein